ncbi:hypothetical protein WDW89_02085 [Deltaproteobacteria bacterium TL4]
MIISREHYAVGQETAFITDYQEVKKILKPIGEETQRAPLLLPVAVSNLEFDFGDPFPPDVVYFHDEEYAW